MNNKLIRRQPKGDYKIIAISDVHGRYEVLDKLLKKVNLKEEDYLVIIGDFINKGVDSLKTFDYIKKLSKRKNTYILKGNHEFNNQSVMKNADHTERAFDFFKEERFENIINGLLKHSNIEVGSFESGTQLHAHLNENHHDVLSFFESLPVVLEIDTFRFVHGGYDPSFCLDTQEHKFLKFDFYNDHDIVNDKTTVVGHWPTCNLRTDKVSNTPYINSEKNIIFIDGGLSVKTTGELNAFIIDKKDEMISYDHAAQNEFVKRTVASAHTFKKEETIYINYPYYEFEVLETGERMTRCRHLHSQKEFSVFNSLLEHRDGKAALKITYVNNFLNLNPSDEVLVCYETEDATLVKHNNEFGWLLKTQFDGGLSSTLNIKV
ncbi:MULTISPECIES: metallophosphoesterase [unclassified Fusibacter]|uniref:metallophosphoesterase n=1 Tax=unclassified Fusibacter TaxID=2624464 RepID=UPI0010109DBA|nr:MULTISPECIES: metallophosphoesterase [unclassified Fusibacter]MCK8058367.1 metallophosphoesterase [Fusibacter sp. A2]NPE20950.1 serine/threonine protein phosphatase [Fusibacter sp. A1]RXV63152.1 serine/threonine protein phosphatase [Fusibacter sp. A1]